MKGLYNAGLITVLSVLTLREITHGYSIEHANLGQKLTLSCDYPSTEGGCFEDTYEWYKLNKTTPSERFELLLGTSWELVVSENVTSVDEVGGMVYKCCCSGGSSTTSCPQFKIGVNPLVELTISNEHAANGSSVNVTCTAKSFPQADQISNYTLTPQPDGTNLSMLPNATGVYFTIPSVNKEEHARTYGCVVTVFLNGERLQSDQAEGTLNIYDPPSIRCTRNQSITNINQAAILECAVYNPESDLNVWVIWTTDENKPIKREHVESRKDDTFYLLFYNASASAYVCNLFTQYSSNKPEDKRVVEISIGMDTADATDYGTGRGCFWICFWSVYAAVSVELVLIVVIKCTLPYLTFFDINKRLYKLFKTFRNYN